MGKAAETERGERSEAKRPERSAAIYDGLHSAWLYTFFMAGLPAMKYRKPDGGSRETSATEAY